MLLICRTGYDMVRFLPIDIKLGDVRLTMSATENIVFGSVFPRAISLTLVAFLFLAFAPFSPAAEKSTGNNDNSASSPATKEKSSACMECHDGVAWIRPLESEMMQEILALGRSRHDPSGCTVCHGGNPTSISQTEAHAGKNFYPDPGSPWINQKTCGPCHPSHVKTQWQSLMTTQADIIQGTAWAFGSMTGYEHKWANYDVANPTDPSARLGTEDYRQYMQRLTALEPQVFVERHLRLPDAPTDLAKLVQQPDLAAFTYLRNQCLCYNTAVKGRQTRGDFRGMGCSMCHIPYGNQGRYEGDDGAVHDGEPNDHNDPKSRLGLPLVHSIQATRDTKVVTDGLSYSGVPVETCATCHNRGKRIGVSFQGLMETPYKSPFTKDGQDQPALHKKHYLAMHQDIHYQKGMLCQDCHTTGDIHGDGFLAACTLAAVEIECSDCHGTPAAYPWELPLGYMDEFEETPAQGPPRGTTDKLLPRMTQGIVYPPGDGYLRSARGNPLGNVVRHGNKVTVHTAGGKDLELKPLKLIAEEKELELAGRVSMQSIDRHMGRMECYACHAAWAPQCYGCFLKIDYAGDKKCFDWLAAGNLHAKPGQKQERGEAAFDTKILGQVDESRSYLRWEDPALAVNGEGRVTPVTPGCQLSATIIGGDGKPILLNHIFHTMPNVEGAGHEGQLAIDTSPINPHTMTNAARTCPSCHLSTKALGRGIGDGRLMRPPDKDVIVDLQTADGRIIPADYETQIAAIKFLTSDWSRFVTKEGKQLQTVGHNFTGSRPLNAEEQEHISRQGVCLSCHQEIPDGSLAAGILHHIGEHTGQLPKTPRQHSTLLHKMLLMTAWGQVARNRSRTGSRPLAGRMVLATQKKTAIGMINIL